MLEGWGEDKVSRGDISHFHINAVYPILDVKTREKILRKSWFYSYEGSFCHQQNITNFPYCEAGIVMI